MVAHFEIDDDAAGGGGGGGSTKAKDRRRQTMKKRLMSGESGGGLTAVALLVQERRRIRYLRAKREAAAAVRAQSFEFEVAKGREHAKSYERFMMGPAQIPRPAAATALTEVDQISHSAGMYEDRGEEERYDDDDDVFLEWSKPSPNYREKHGRVWSGFDQQYLFAIPQTKAGGFRKAKKGIKRCTVSEINPSSSAGAGGAAVVVGAAVDRVLLGVVRVLL